MKYKYLKAFILGSSFPVTIWPFFYLGTALHLNPQTGFDYALVPFTLPFLFGIVNVLQLSIAGYLPKNINTRYWLIGLLYGLGLSLYGNFGKDLPVDLFQLPDTAMQYILIPIAMLLYGLVWRYIVKNLNHHFGIE